MIKPGSLHDYTQAQRSLCVTLRPALAGGYISEHLDAITQAIQGLDRTLEVDVGHAYGECHVLLPLHYCMVRAQSLTDRLNNLVDDRGRCILEAEVSNGSSAAQKKRSALALTPHPSAEGS